MLRLSQSDLEATLHFLRQAEAVTGPDPFPSELLDVLRGLVPSEFVAYDELDLVERRVLIYVACTRGQEVEASQPDEEELDRNFLRLMHQHPICSHRLRTGDHTAHKFSDFVTRKQLHGLEIHAEYFRRYGVEFRMAVGLPGPPTHTKTLGFDRVGNRDFGERDRVLLNRLRPHLTALHAAARDRRRAAALLLGQDRAGIVVLLSPDQIDFATPAATRLLTRYFGTASDSRLPEPVRTWLHRDAVRLNGNGLPRATTVPLTVEHGNRRLTIRRAGHTLLLDEQVATLTRRERQIVDQLAKGRSNAEIAERLTIARTTVRTHLENIYAKLGVNSRTAAVAATRLEADNQVGSAA